MNLEHYTLSDLTDSEGAMKVLSARFGRAVTHDSVRQYVKEDKLRSLQFEGGSLIVRVHGAATRGRDLLFLRSDLLAMPVPGKSPGRPVAHASTRQAKYNQEYYRLHVKAKRAQAPSSAEEK